MIQKVVHWRRYLTSFQLIILGFADVILLGALILMLPVASASGAWTPFRESLFTSTSAVCVTGLVIYDSGSYWSGFGQGVILLLIQIGGLGVITMAATFLMLAGKNISLKERSAMQDAISAPAVGGIVRLTRFILKGTFFIELLGALAMLPVFCRDYGSRGIWMSVFHSVSAFCNAGFDILGRPGNLYPSLTAYIADPLINIIVVLLIVTGGIGFLTWDDVCTHRLHLRRYRMQSKVILAATGLLILFPAVLFFFTDFSDLPMEQRFLASLFQAVTPRTAGYNTADLTAMTEASRAVMTVLMLIGGAPGSTAGGMKVTTLTVLTANAFATFRRRAEPQLFHRRLEGAAIRNASTILMLYLTLFFTGAVIISTAEGLPLSACLYETASAVGTVGLTLGLTPQLGALSQWILIVLMFLGRVGGLTLIYAAYSGRDLSCARFPQEKITVG
ncbi:MAG: TrkH family potassium uptake protein [Angelakisella sp.]